jgi:LysM domain
MDGETTNGRLRRTIARVLAVLAIAGVVIALVVVVGGSMGDSGGGEGNRQERRAAQREQEQSDATYVVQENDTLAGIAEKTGVSVEDLQNLNPDIDPQALPAGATLQLR